jgi:hypothetical protein
MPGEEMQAAVREEHRLTKIEAAVERLPQLIAAEVMTVKLDVLQRLERMSGQLGQIIPRLDELNGNAAHAIAEAARAHARHDAHDRGRELHQAEDRGRTEFKFSIRGAIAIAGAVILGCIAFLGNTIDLIQRFI